MSKTDEMKCAGDTEAERMNAVRFTISGELLVHLLHLPEGSTLIRARQVIESPNACDIELFVTNPDLPKIVEGDVIPEVRPLYSNIYGKSVFESWGLPKDTPTNHNIIVLKAKETVVAINGIQSESST